MKRFQAIALASALLLTSSAFAQTNVSPLHKFSWSENCGWMNWRDAGSPPGSQGARLHALEPAALHPCEAKGTDCSAPD